MVYAPGFQHDVFISYAHLDNDPFGPANERWVDMFHRSLSTAVAQHLGAPPAFWRDPRLRGTDEFSPEIEARLAASAVFLPIFSPAYLASDWCRREFEAFLRNAGGPAALRVENKLRIVKVVKTHVARETLPAAVSNVLGYQFYSLDQSSEHTKNLLFTGGATAFWAMIDDLAQDLAQLLRLLAENKPRGVAPPAGVVYLAETTSDVEEERRQLKRELLDRGYSVLPDQWLPTDGHQIEETVGRYLDQAALYIQLLGTPYGASLEADPRSIPALQYEVYRAHNEAKGGCEALLWSQPGGQIKDPRQQAFLASVEASLTEGIELLVCPLEDLKSIALNKLARKKAQPPEPAPPADEVVRVYVVCDQQDKDKLKPLKNHFHGIGVEPLLPGFKRGHGAREIRQLHYDHLEVCDGVLIYWGEGDDNWLQAKLSDIRKAPHYRKNIPLRATTVLISDPPSPDKDDFRTREADILRHFGEFSPPVLSPFLSRLGLAR